MPTTTPQIVGDFEYEGLGFLVVFWPESEDESSEFQVYRDDLPWSWRHEAVDVRE